MRANTTANSKRERKAFIKADKKYCLANIMKLKKYIRFSHMIVDKSTM